MSTDLVKDKDVEEAIAQQIVVALIEQSQLHGDCGLDRDDVSMKEFHNMYKLGIDYIFV